MSDVYATYPCADNRAIRILVAYATYQMLLLVDAGALVIIRTWSLTDLCDQSLGSTDKG